MRAGWIGMIHDPIRGDLRGDYNIHLHRNSSDHTHCRIPIIRKVGIDAPIVQPILELDKCRKQQPISHGLYKICMLCHGTGQRDVDTVESRLVRNHDTQAKKERIIDHCHRKTVLFDMHTRTGGRIVCNGRTGHIGIIGLGVIQ